MQLHTYFKLLSQCLNGGIDEITRTVSRQYYQPGIKQGILEYKKKVLYHVHPLLGNDREISNYAIAVTT
jgi:hypothetical protein